MTERDERALRAALRSLAPDEPVDPGAARRRAAERRRNRQTLAGVVTVLVLVVGVVGVPRLLSGGGSEATSAGQADTRAEQAPAGGAAAESESDARASEAPSPRAAAPAWRTEYYRDISFEVPADWGYAVPPQSDWCAGNSKGQLRPDQRRPYVWLGAPIPVRSILCPERPDSLLTEHVEALSPGPATDYAEGAVRRGDWWVITRFAGSAVLVVTTKDEGLAEQILGSARVKPEDAPCAPSSPVAGPLGARPDPAVDLTGVGPVDRVALCQYEPTEDRGDAALPRLRAVQQLTGEKAQTLVDDLTAAPVNDSRCDPEPIDRSPQLAVLVRMWVQGEVSEVYVNPSGCPDGGRGMFGGIDDGTTVRVVTRESCSRLLTPPVAIWSANGDVARNCLR